MIFFATQYLVAHIPNPYYVPHTGPRFFDPDGVVFQDVLIMPDGTEVDVERIHGGENNPVILYRKYGYTIEYHRELGWCWAYQNEEGWLRATNFPIHLTNPDTLGLDKNIRMSKDRADEIRNRINNTHPNRSDQGSLRGGFQKYPNGVEIESVIIFLSLNDLAPISTPPSVFV